MIEHNFNILQSMGGYIIYYCVVGTLRSMSAVFFIIVGINSKFILQKIRTMKVKYVLWIGVALLSCVAYGSRYVGKIDMHLLLFGQHKVLFILLALMGTATIIIISQWINKTTIIKQLFLVYGKNSLFIMAIHNYFRIFFLIKKYVMSEMVCIILFYILLFIVTVALAKPIDHIINIIDNKIVMNLSSREKLKA